MRSAAQSLDTLVSPTNFPMTAAKKKAFNTKKPEIKASLNALVALIDSDPVSITIQGASSLNKLRENVRKNLKALLSVQTPETFATVKIKCTSALKSLVKALQ